MSKTKNDKKFDKEKVTEQQNQAISTLKKLLEQKNSDNQKLEQECEHLKNIISLMPGHVYWQNADGIFLGCNYLQAKDAGLESINDYLGKTDYDMPWRAQADILRQLNKKVLQTGEPHVAEEPSRLANGAYAIFLSQKVPLKDKNGKIIGIVGISFDITERKKIEQELAEQIKKTERANQSKTVFMQTASHEVRGPVANVLSLVDGIMDQFNELRKSLYSEIVKLTGDDKDKSTKIILNVENWFNNAISELKTIYIEAYKALDALKNLGELHRIELEGVESHLEETDIEGLINRAYSEWKSDNKYVQEKNVVLSINVAPTLSSKIFIDKSNILRVLKIVIGNAIKYSRENGVVVITVGKEKEREVLIIKVEDFGVGINYDHLNALLDNSISSEVSIEKYSYKKPSLKLTQAKLLLEASDSSIDIQSQHGKGTTVILTIPLSPLNKVVINKPKTSEKSFTNVNEAGRKVLLMEDDVLTQKVERKYLEKCGCIVDVVDCGLDAIKAVKANKYQVAFLDITVPDMDGVEVMQILKQLDPKLSVIAITSHVSSDNQEYFQDQGFDAILTKPVDDMKLKEIVDIIFENKDS